jgi:hypothetical protein
VQCLSLHGGCSDTQANLENVYGSALSYLSHVPGKIGNVLQEYNLACSERGGEFAKLGQRNQPAVASCGKSCQDRTLRHALPHDRAVFAGD